MCPRHKHSLESRERCSGCVFNLKVQTQRRCRGPLHGVQCLLKPLLPLLLLQQSGLNLSRSTCIKEEPLAVSVASSKLHFSEMPPAGGA